MSTSRFVVSLISQVCVAVGILIGIAAWEGNDTVRWSVGAIVLIFVLISMTLLISEYKAHRAKRYPTPARINQFMHSWISQPGRTAIFSNDMTWVSGEIHVRPLVAVIHKLRGTRAPSIKELLIRKARADELLLCIPRPNELSNELAAEGAAVSTYEALNLVPKSRFTIVRYGQAGAAVAIGRADQDGVHEIERFSEGHHPGFALASDLVDFVRRYDEVHG